MKAFSEQLGYSLVTAILSRSITGNVLDAVIREGGAHVLTQSARGSLLKDRWYERFLPAFCPEQEILNFLVPETDVYPLMEQIVMVGEMQRFGAGSIYATPCESFVCSDDYPLWRPGHYQFESVNFDIRFNENLVALVQITDKGQADAIARAAIKAGAPGPTINYIRGFGLRDRLGLLRITKTHEKERITVVLDQYDMDAVFQALALAGRVDQPGRGIVYQVPVSKGLQNMASVFAPRRHSASIQQIIHAIDQMQGETHWRAKELLIHDPKAQEFSTQTQGVIQDLKALNITCHRKDIEVLLYCALDQGIPGASVSDWRLIEADAKQTTGGVRLNREFGRITMILNADSIRPMVQELQNLISEEGFRETCFFTHPVPVMRTYQSSTLADKAN